MAPAYWQASRQSPHPSQRDGSTLATNGSISTWSLASRVVTLAAAADAAEVLSVMSMGACAVPARSRPGMALSTGRSFGCTSSRKPSLPTGALVMSIRSATSRGMTPTLRTTRSTGTSISVPKVSVSRTFTRSG